MSEESMARRPIAVDLFSGAGGLSLGLEQAGFDVLAAVEFDPVHAAAHLFNFPECAVIPRSVVGLTGAEIRSLSKIGASRVDLVVGGAPCQGFSMIGQRALDDPRNSLVREFVRIVIELDATYFVFENVKGLTLGVHRKFLVELIEAFGEAGYDIVLPWRVLNAAHYGTPQNRERLFLMGAKRGKKSPKYPHAKTRLPTKTQSILPTSPSCLEALGDLPCIEEILSLRDCDSAPVADWHPKTAYARELRCEDESSWRWGYRRTWSRGLLTNSGQTLHTPISVRRFAETEEGCVEPVSRFFKLAANSVSNTLRAGSDAARGAFTSPRPIHYRYPRCITVREMARLHGFPDWFRFHETKWNGARQIGNAVPPPLAREVGSAIIEALGIEPSRPARILELGSESLLTMTMSQAAAFWSIPVPIGRRDRKSGSRKRRQSDIEAERLRAAG